MKLRPLGKPLLRELESQPLLANRFSELGAGINRHAQSSRSKDFDTRDYKYYPVSTKPTNCMDRSKSKTPHGKYDPDLLIKMFRKAAALRNEMVAAGFTDNGGAIHCAERILDILGQRLNYPGLSHGNKLKHYKKAEFSDEAWALHQAKKKVLVEHVSPRRHLTQMAIAKIGTSSDAQFKAFVKRHYKTVLLSPDETRRLNRLNRSRVCSDRLTDAGIEVTVRRVVSSNEPMRGVVAKSL